MCGGAGGAVSGLAVGERCEDSGLLSECGTVLRTWASTGTVLPAGGSKVGAKGSTGWDVVRLSGEGVVGSFW